MNCFWYTFKVQITYIDIPGLSHEIWTVNRVWLFINCRFDLLVKYTSNFVTAFLPFTVRDWFRVYRDPGEKQHTCNLGVGRIGALVLLHPLNISRLAPTVGVLNDEGGGVDTAPLGVGSCYNDTGQGAASPEEWPCPGVGGQGYPPDIGVSLLWLGLERDGCCQANDRIKFVEQVTMQRLYDLDELGWGEEGG